MRPKYVVGDLQVSGLTTAILIPAFMNHSDIRGLFSEIHSAGFYYIADDKVSVYGNSVSLNVSSKPEDAKYITQTLNL